MFRIIAAAVAGLAAAIVGASALSVMSFSTPEGAVVPAITVLARAVHAESLLVGWSLQLIAGVVVGALFGVLFLALPWPAESGVAWGAIYGLAWWVLGWLVGLPLALGFRPFAPVLTPALRQVAIAGLLAWLLYGVVLGGVCTWLVARRRPQTAEQRHRAMRAA